MEKFNELLEKLNKEKIECTDCGWEENLPEDVWEEYFNKKEYKVVESGLDQDEHRWYCISTTVIKIFGKYLGITHISNLYSESMDAEDCSVDCKFFEMKEKQSVTYVSA